MTIKLTVLLSLVAITTWAQARIGGGELNPGLYTNAKAIKRFQDARIGISIHWGPSSLSGEEISWSRGNEVPRAEYDELYKKFNPTRYNATEWADLIKSFGARYVVFTTKHHDGFAMWHSDYSPYTIKNTPFGRDVLKELSDACQQKGILFGTYYSSLDWYHPDYQPYGHGGPGPLFPMQADTPNQQHYWIYMKNQVRELVTKYNSKLIQFDGDWDSTWTHAIGSDAYLYIRKLNDEVVVNNRTDKGRYIAPGQKETGIWKAPIYAGDFEERERITTNFTAEESKVLGKSPYPWQAWVTLDKSQWSWKKNFTFMPYETVLVDLLKTVGDGGNYLLNIGPRPDGSFEPEAIRIMQQVGRWLGRHETLIYGTQGGPFVADKQYTSTRKYKQINLFVFDRTAKSLTLDARGLTITTILTDTNKPVAFRQTGDTVTFPAVSSDAFVAVYRIMTQ